jgi:ATP-dependent helicase/nuclease subunit A
VAPVNLTSQQWEIVREASRHVLVAASAGTGKTSTVVSRLLYLLGGEVRGERIAEERRITLRDVAAITFTNASAGDLVKKLREALRGSGMRQAAYEVDAARVGTIHSFCVGILREFALRLPRSPGTELLEDAEGMALRAEAARDAILEAAERGDVPGLPDLLAERSVGDVEAFVELLAEDGDRLDTYARNATDLGERERTLLALALRARDLLAARLDARGALDFDSMIVLTRDLLRDNAAVRRALQRRIRVLIVDEFQDVDPAQKEIAYLLGEPLTDSPSSTRLLLVGDPKQSIFRFRRADVTVWTEVERDFRARPATCLVQPLTENFRSREPILGLVDAAVGALIETPIDGSAHQPFEVRYEPFVPTQALRGDGPAVELIVVPPGPDGKTLSAPVVREAEARAMARRATELLADGSFDPPLKPRDLAVVLTGWGAREVYEGALRDAGLPTYTVQPEGFWRRREVIDLFLALDVLHDPFDDRALLGWLRSPFVGLRDDTLLAVARQAEPPYWPKLGDLKVAEQGLLDWARAVLERHLAIRDRVPADVLLESLLDETGFAAHLQFLGSERGEPNVRKFLRFLREMPEATLGEALRALREVREAGGREGDAPLEIGGGGAITITSIHSAKGLEWRVVFWCDLVRGRGPNNDPLLRGRGRFALRDPDAEPDEQPELVRQLLAEEAAEHQAEQKRLHYVAMTRAKERLILCGIPLGEGKKGRDAAAGRLWPLLEQGADPGAGQLRYGVADGRQFVGAIRTADLGGVVEGGAAGEGMPVADALLPAPGPVGSIEELPGPLPIVTVPSGRRRHSASELLAFERCARKHWFKYITGLRESEVLRGTPQFVDAVTRGLIVHDVLERLEEDADLARLLEEAIGRWDEDAPASGVPEGVAYREHLREEVESVARNPEYRAIADLPSARRELGFIHLLEGGGITEGKIDLAALRDDGLVLLDVKTSQLTAERARQRAEDYAPQRDVYVAAAEAISGEPAATFGFQFSRAEVQVAEAITPALRQEIGSGLARTVKAIEAGDCSLTQHPWECRFCGYKEVGWCEGRA